MEAGFHLGGDFDRVNIMRPVGFLIGLPILGLVSPFFGGFLQRKTRRNQKKWGPKEGETSNLKVSTLPSGSNIPGPQTTGKQPLDF